MTQEQKEQAAILVEYVLNDEAWHLTKEKEAALITAISVLRGQGWVRASERLPTEEDGEWVLVVSMYDGPVVDMNKACCVEEMADTYPYWMPLPPLPEADE